MAYSQDINNRLYVPLSPSMDDFILIATLEPYHFPYTQ